VAIKLMWDVDGVVDVIDRLGTHQPPSTTAHDSQPVPQQPGEPPVPA
jgi:hypothetical protein